MPRFLLFALFLTLPLTGCGKRKEAPPVSDAEQRKAMEDYARAKAPVLDRTIIENDLKNIHLFLRTAHDASPNGRWLDAKTAKEQIKQDPNSRKLVGLIDDGTYVLANNPPDGGILAHCSKETTMGIIFVDTNGSIEILKPNEFQARMAQQRR